MAEQDEGAPQGADKPIDGETPASPDASARGPSEDPVGATDEALAEAADKAEQLRRASDRTPTPAGADERASAALDAAKDALAMAQEASPHGAANGSSNGDRPVDLPAFDGANGGAPAGDLDLLSDVNLHVKIELGRTRMLVEDVLKLGEGSVVELDKLAGDPVDIYVNERHVARGEVLVVNDNFCVRISEILTQTTDD